MNMGFELVTYISREQAVHCKGPTFALVVSVQHNEHVFDSDYQSHGPDDEGESAHKIDPFRSGAEGR